MGSIGCDSAGTLIFRKEKRQKQKDMRLTRGVSLDRLIFPLMLILCFASGSIHTYIDGETQIPLLSLCLIRDSSAHLYTCTCSIVPLIGLRYHFARKAMECTRAL